MKRALVTGAGGRIGREIALALADRGFDVAVHFGASNVGADETVALISGKGRAAVALRADLCDENQTKALLPRAAEALGGPITVLVNNAAVFQNDLFESAGRESWDLHMGVNLRAPFVLMQALAAQAPDPVVDTNGEPVAQALVINMADHWARDLAPEFASYAIAKAALHPLTEIAAKSLAGKVRVNAIGPGPTIPGTRQRPEHFAAQRRATPTGRGPNVEDIVAALNYLLDANAVTGEFLHVDGGLHLGWQNPNPAIPDGS